MQQSLSILTILTTYFSKRKLNYCLYITHDNFKLRKIFAKIYSSLYLSNKNHKNFHTPNIIYYYHLTLAT